jgi:glycosyltransferase involved in cell wall biosynthesis
MSASPPLSVLLPVRNGEGVIRTALDSLSRQTFPDFEVIVVDDGSTDGTLEIVRDLAEDDERIRVFQREASGIVQSLEFARTKARGGHLARMDADDGAFPHRFLRQMEHMASDRRLALTGAGVAYFPRESVRDGALRYEAWVNSISSHDDLVRDIFVECPIPHPTFLIRAHVLDIVGGYRESGWPEDYDLILRLWEGGAKLGKVPETLLRWREGEGRLSRTHEAYSESAFRRCKVHFLLRTHLRGGRGVVVWGAGPVGKAFARELVAQGGTLLAFVDLNPRKVGQDIYGVQVLRAEEALRFPQAFYVAAVAKGGGREEIRKTLREAGRVESRDFVAVA